MSEDREPTEREWELAEKVEYYGCNNFEIRENIARALAKYRAERDEELVAAAQKFLQAAPRRIRKNVGPQVNPVYEDDEPYKEARDALAALVEGVGK